MVDYATFVAAFPEFASTMTFPEAQVAFWLGQAPNQISERLFGANYNLASMLFAAHNLALGAKDAKAAAFGGIGGSSSGLTSSKTVDKVTVSYDTGSTTITGAGAWNLTTYGTRLYKMMQGAYSGPFYAANRRARIT
ncbi:DUF4054 domain-containing protein [Xanthobacter agilis]|uniref:DUF4054 domain-containing protein n=1 Tax=Xanthobacter agilis TaxID=47492 RepID=A0ABU0LJX3_XANAG|nr:DUF4054 domain-containing protein [Xanthobacter agilis]MDQ0507405.1 hypothetical protein [Xanthobacter agilis]